MDTGLGWYEFNYKINPNKRYRGVMANEVKDSMPEAVITGDDGFMYVRYDLLGLAMEEVS
jgi:hypothetical protein